MNNLFKNSYELIATDLEIERQEDDINSDEVHMIEMIADRVRVMMDREVELLFSYLYRLDVAVYKVNAILFQHKGEDAIMAIAELIWNRQKRRMETKLKYKQDDHIEGWEW